MGGLLLFSHVCVVRKRAFARSVDKKEAVNRRKFGMIETTLLGLSREHDGGRI